MLFFPDQKFLFSLEKTGELNVLKRFLCSSVFFGVLSQASTALLHFREQCSIAKFPKVRYPIRWQKNQNLDFFFFCGYYASHSPWPVYSSCVSNLILYVKV